MNRYEWKEALIVAKERLDDGQLLEDNAGEKWDIYNLMDQEDGIENAVIDADHYYVVGFDGSIGYTCDNGYNVSWLYKVD